MLQEGIVLIKLPVKARIAQAHALIAMQALVTAEIQEQLTNAVHARRAMQPDLEAFVQA